MKNYVRAGDKFTVKAPYDVESGDVVKVMNIRGIAITSAREGEEVTISTTGIYELKKDDVAVKTGELAYYREDLKLVTNESLHTQEDTEIKHVLLGFFVRDEDETSRNVEVKLVG